MTSAPQTESPELRLSRVLLIVEEPAAAKSYWAAFRTLGFRVDEVSDGPSGLAALDDDLPDAVVIEFSADHLSQMEMIKHLRARPACAGLPVIACLDSPSFSAFEMVRNAGATIVVRKQDCPPQKVAETVSRLLGKKVAVPAVAALLPLPALSSDQSTARLLQQFLLNAPPAVAALHRELEKIFARGDEPKLTHVFALRDQLHGFAGGAAMVNLPNLSQTSQAIEALLADYCYNPGRISPAGIHTVAAGLDLLGQQLQGTLNPRTARLTEGTALILVAEETSRCAAALAVTQVRFRPIFSPDVKVAGPLLAENRFDLCILDLDLGGHALAFCREVRARLQPEMPVIFLANTVTVETRSQVKLAGGTEVLGKPFLGSELALKTLLLTAHHRTGSAFRPVLKTAAVPVEMPAPPSISSTDVVLNEAGPPSVPTPAEVSLPAARPRLQIRKLLVPVDFSACSQKALRYAVGFAQEYGAALDLLHVTSSYPGHDPFDLPTGERLEQERRAAGEKKLAELVREFVPDGLAVETFVRSGRPVTEIIEKAKELGSDLIIISTHGYQGLSAINCGGITEGVVRQAPCPLLVVREHEHEFLPA